MENLERNIKGFTVGQDNQMDDFVRELQAVILRLKELIKCLVCHRPLDNSHAVCKNGHVVCQPCKRTLRPTECPQCKNKFVVAKNTILCQILECIPRICPFQGCTEMFISSTSHDDICVFRTIKCKLKSCDWQGHMKDLMEHIKVKHDQELIHIPDEGVAQCLLTISSVKECKSEYLVCCYKNNIFWKLLRRNGNTKEMWYSFFHLPTAKPTKHFYFVVSFKKGYIEFTSTSKAYTNDNESSFFLKDAINIPDSELHRFLCSKTDKTYQYTIRVVEEDYLQ